MKNEFDLIAISETWCKDDSINVNSLYQIPNYIPIDQIWKIGNKCGGLAKYIHKTVTFKIFEKLSNNNEHIESESLSIEIIRTNQKNIILLCIYRPLRGDHNIFTSKIRNLIERRKQNQKLVVGDLNLNTLNTTNDNDQNFLMLPLKIVFFLW